ncbi:MAG: response regulator transcription factor [Ignavibacteriales bacterium]|nr:response regulator transcription factor [Ignavibacteriales bacterium]MCF8306956.1 response regulator transcription factor [Ignavibacteriales bacterium]MCF8437396.1 response regulator transcription factor [Ignavibacteriales bacterium]
MNKIRLLLIEDNRLLRDGIISILNSHKDIEIVEVSDPVGNTIIRIHELKPDIVLLDLGLRSLNSLNVVEIIKKEFPEIKIIVMDLGPVNADITQYANCGANGIILKDSSLENFLSIIRSVSRGVLSLPVLAPDSLFNKIVEQAVKAGKPALKEAAHLTKRELGIIELLSEGLNNKEIGQRYHISTLKVKSHIKNIIEKLTLHTQLENANFSFTFEALKAIEKGVSIINS